MTKLTDHSLLKKGAFIVEADALKKDLYQAEVLGVKVTSAPLSRVIRIIEERCKKSTHSRLFFIATVNPEFVMKAQSDSEFRNILNSADLALADGNGLKFADPLLATITPGRKIVETLVRSKRLKLFYLGGQPGVAEAMARNFGGRGEMGARVIREELESEQGNVHSLQLIKAINAFRPDVLLVAYGAPWQEKWIWKYRNELQVKVAIGVGGSFDYLLGRAKVPPEFIHKLGFEWLWRLVREPWRLKRQLKGGMFFLKVLQQRFSLH